MTVLHVGDLLTTVTLAVDCLALLWFWRNRNRLFTERHRETETDEPDEGMGLREVGRKANSKGGVEETRTTHHM